jgi:hypothetical protein
MLEFAAHTYVDVAWRFGQVFAFGRSPDPNLLRETLNDLFEDATRLDLPVTKEYIASFFVELAKENPDKVRLSGAGRFEVLNASIDWTRTQHYVEALHRSLTTELKSILLRVIPRERVTFWNDGWLVGAKLATSFPTSATELQRAARCYSVGEPTACVFHSMRALEPGLAALAKPFSVSSAHENWQNIISEIEAEIRKLGNLPKSVARIEDEKFFGAAVSHLYFIKNAWRNHVAHTRDSYSDAEAVKVLERSRDFIESLCPRLSE